MKEVKLNRYAGPFEQIPYQNYVQSPIGQVPMAGDKTRLIFHLSYDFLSQQPDEHRSINFYTDSSLCKVKYKDLDHAIASSLALIKSRLENQDEHVQLYYTKPDVVSVFRVTPIKPQQRHLLVMMAPHPVTQQIFYLFVVEHLRDLIKLFLKEIKEHLSVLEQMLKIYKIKRLVSG